MREYGAFNWPHMCEEIIKANLPTVDSVQALPDIAVSSIRVCFIELFSALLDPTNPEGWLAIRRISREERHSRKNLRFNTLADIISCKENK